MKFEDYVTFIIEEGDLSNSDELLFMDRMLPPALDESMSQKQARIGDAKIRHIGTITQNAAYFIDKLVRKQVLVELKKELKKAREARDRDAEEMKR